MRDDVVTGRSERAAVHLLVAPSTSPRGPEHGLSRGRPARRYDRLDLATDSSVEDAMAVVDDAQHTALDWRDSPSIELSAILTAALDAFHDNGFHGTSVRDIAARVGVTVPALYYHHENKEMILFALLDASIDQLQRLCEAAVAEAVDRPEDVFFNLFESITRYMSKSGRLSYLDSEIRSLSPALREVYVAKRDAIESMVLAEVEAGVASGAFAATSPRDTTRALLGMVQAITTWYRPDGDLSVDDVAATYRDIAGRTVGAAPDVFARATGARPTEGGIT